MNTQNDFLLLRNHVREMRQQRAFRVGYSEDVRKLARDLAKKFGISRVVSETALSKGALLSWINRTDCDEESEENNSPVKLEVTRLTRDMTAQPISSGSLCFFFQWRSLRVEFGSRSGK